MVDHQTPQSEQQLEDALIVQLNKQGFDVVSVNDEASMLANLKAQLEKLNGIDEGLSEQEFKQVLNHLGKGNVFEKAKTLRDRFEVKREDGTSKYIQFLVDELSADNLDSNGNPIKENRFQVTQQVTVEGRYKNRYDVTVLVNGLPLLQIELKRRGLELKEAFNQINRYQRHSYWANYGLFQYVQVFVISNGVNTKYYANNKTQSFKQTFYWADRDNNRFTKLADFAAQFLKAPALSTLLNQYIVLNETDKILMVMRPYQIYATEAIVEKVQRSIRAELSEGDTNGYIWHTTGSGKTLTSFKTAQLVTKLPEIHKVVFVVDRKDLDYQTAKEFNAFKKGCVDSTDRTNVLVSQFTDTAIRGREVNASRNEKLIVTTIQKLNNAISHRRYSKQMEDLKDKPIVFIFDECHRSQFGDTHQRIVNFFANHQMFGFTGTPIFVENAHVKATRRFTTKDLFHERLHEYTIVDAIKDENVLKFGVEYVGRYKKANSANEVDIDVEGIDTNEILEDDRRVEKIADYIIAHHNSKTHSKTFTGMFCVSSVPMLIKYYQQFAKRKEEGAHNLRIATIFSYAANEEDPEANGFLGDVDEAPEVEATPQHQVSDMAAEPYSTTTANSEKIANPVHSRDHLESFIGDYNAMFETSFTTKDSESFYNYYNDIAKKVKERKVDILLVVNMFLTGFDSKPLNTLYVDKNLKHHGLIQAYSRTNRILNEQKSQGNIVAFRNLKKRTDDALKLFSNKDAAETVIMPEYDEFVRMFNKAYGQLLGIAPDLESIDQLRDENEEFEFTKAFRELIRLLNVLHTFADFSFDDLKMGSQEFEDYKSKYLDLYDKVKTDQAKHKESVLMELDFELELIGRDEINVAYILKLIADLKDAGSDKDYEYKYKQIKDLLGGTPELRSKKELIEKFIAEYMDGLDTKEQVLETFEVFWEKEKQIFISRISEEEQLDKERFSELIDEVMLTGKQPLREDLIGTLQVAPSILHRKTKVAALTQHLENVVATFDMGA